MTEEEIRGEIGALLQRVSELQGMLTAKGVAELKTLTDSGWKEFDFHSDYYGSHPEYGEGDIDKRYLFHPEVDVSRWDGVLFSHGHYDADPTKNEFMDWLETLTTDQYLEVD